MVSAGPPEPAGLLVPPPLARSLVRSPCRRHCPPSLHRVLPGSRTDDLRIGVLSCLRGGGSGDRGRDVSFSPALLGLLSGSRASCFKLGTVFLVSPREKLGRHLLLICLFELGYSFTRYL